MERAAALVCVCALLVTAAPAPPGRTQIKESKAMREKSIVVRRMPNAYFYPHSLWPLPKYPERGDESSESFQYRSLQNIRFRQNER